MTEIIINDIKVPETISIFSDEQVQDYCKDCALFWGMNLPVSEKLECCTGLLTLFCAYALQPVRDGRYDPEKVRELEFQFTRTKDKTDINMVGLKFSIVATEYLKEQYRIKAITDSINLTHSIN